MDGTTHNDGRLRITIQKQEKYIYNEKKKICGQKLTIYDKLFTVASGNVDETTAVIVGGASAAAIAAAIFKMNVLITVKMGDIC